MMYGALEWRNHRFIRPSGQQAAIRWPSSKAEIAQAMEDGDAHLKT